MRVFIGCSGSNSIPNKYKDLAVSVSTLIAKRGHKLVFGGVDTGMMQSCYMTFKYEDKKIKGVSHLKDAPKMKELELDAYQVCGTVFERTKALFESSELIIILPGGIGTIQELFSILDEVRTGLDKKRIILFDYEKFYTPMLKFLEKLHEEKFINDTDLKKISIVRNIDSLEKYLEMIERV